MIDFKKIFISALATTAVSLNLNAQLVSMPHGAKISLDSITAEITVISPSVVRVTKYVGTKPELSTPKYMPEDNALPDTLRRVEEAGKLKVDTGRYYAAMNAKDGNVSFWNHEGQLILAEQHKTGRFSGVAPGGYSVSQDFQIGKSEADSIYCPGVGVNLKGDRVEFGSDKAPQPMVATERGYSIYWNTPGRGYMDDTPGREVKKPGDVTFSSPSTSVIDYYFIVK